MTSYFTDGLDEMIGGENEKDRMIYRLLGSILGGFGREFGVSKLREIVRYIAENDSFWNTAKLLKK